MERFFKKPPVVAQLRCGPLASFLDEIAQELQDDGYALSTARFQLLVASDFSGWLERESINPQCISRQYAMAYMRHRDERRCPSREDAEAALNRLFEFLARRQIIAEAGPDPKSEIAQVVDLFGTYLLEQRGLSPRTVSGYRMFAQRFISAISDSGKFEPSRLCNTNRKIIPNYLWTSNQASQELQQLIVWFEESRQTVSLFGIIFNSE